MVSCFFYDTFAGNKNIIMGRGDIKTKKEKLSQVALVKADHRKLKQQHQKKQL